MPKERWEELCWTGKWQSRAVSGGVRNSKALRADLQFRTAFGPYSPPTVAYGSCAFLVWDGPLCWAKWTVPLASATPASELRPYTYTSYVDLTNQLTSLGFSFLTSEKWSWDSSVTGGIKAQASMCMAQHVEQ